MEEKVLINSERYSIKKLYYILVIIGATVTIAWLCKVTLGSTLDRIFQYWKHQKASCSAYNIYMGVGEKCYICKEISAVGIGAYLIDNLHYAFTRYITDILLALIPVVASVLISVLLYFWLRSYELTITDKRIYGKVAWGKRVDLPVDLISATATNHFWKGVSVSTSSGRISFLLIKNADSIYDTLNQLIIERHKKNNSVVANTVPTSSNADELKKYKELLDTGIITQEEFDAKKKQLLGL